MAKKIIIGVFLFIVICFFSMIGLIFFSPLPLKLMASAAQKNGVTIEGLSGSLNSGFSFEKLTYSDANTTVSATGVKFAWSSIYKTFVERKMAIENIEASQVTIESSGTSAMPKEGTQQPGEEKPHSNSHSSIHSTSNGKDPLKAIFRGPENPNGLVDFRVEHINVRDFVIRDKARGFEFKLSQYTLEKLRFAYDEATLQSFVVDSNFASLALKNAQYKDGVIQLPDPITGSIKTELLKTVLKKNLDFTIQAKFQGKDLENADIKTFDGKVHLHGSKKSIAFEIQNFVPTDFFILPHPISFLNLKAADTPVMSLMTGSFALEGSLKLGATEFIFDPTRPGFNSSAKILKKIFSLTLNPVLLVQSFKTPAPLFTLQGPSTDLEENMAWVFYEKTKAKLSPEELNTLSSWKAYFSGASVPTATGANETPATGSKTPASSEKAHPLKSTLMKAKKRGRR